MGNTFGRTQEKGKNGCLQKTSEEWKRNASQRMTGEKQMYGKHHTHESRRKISQVNLAKNILKNGRGRRVE